MSQKTRSAKTRKRRKVLGSCMILLGLLSLSGAAALFLYNNGLEEKAEELADGVVPILHQIIQEKTFFMEEGAEDGTNSQSTVMETAEVEGLEYIGILTLPTLKLEMPILSEWNNPNLKRAPCRYKGTIQERNLIIAGHNYKNHFGLLEGLSLGETVLFTQLNGTVTEYIISRKEQLEGSDVDKMAEGEWDLTLFTCTISGKKRVTLRCVRSEAAIN